MHDAHRDDGPPQGTAVRRRARIPPVLDWLPRYSPRWLPLDVTAGVTVWALIVPEAMAYAAIAGVPVQYGLFAVPLALVGYAVFGTCRELFVGPSATIASLSAVTVGPWSRRVPTRAATSP
jgi:MFS superfamily sulfate permease-like transporter